MKQKLLSLLVVFVFLLSIFPLQVLAEAEQGGEGQAIQENWRQNSTYRQLKSCHTLDQALLFLSHPINLVRLMGVEDSAIYVVMEDGSYLSLDHYFEKYGEENKRASKINEVWIDESEIGKDNYPINFNKQVPKSAIRDFLVELDLREGNSRCALEQLYMDATAVGDNYWQALCKTVTGMTSDEITELIVNIDKLIEVLTENGGDMLSEDEWSEISDILGGGVDAAVFLNGVKNKLVNDEELSANEWKALVNLCSKVGTKLVGKVGKGALKSVGIKVIPIIGQVAGIFLDAAEEQKEAKEFEAAFEASQKWIEINLGLNAYALSSESEYNRLAERNFNQWKKGLQDPNIYPRTPRDPENPTSRDKQREEEAKDQAEYDAERAIISGAEDAARNPFMNHESNACYHFQAAYSKTAKRPAREILSYDPERVEVEDYLIRGEDYPKII
jgi:hypothetical protein